MQFKPKLNLIRYPTPFHELPHLRRALGAVPRLFIKRDDLTEIGLGGNKNRKLDYVMAEAAANGADTVITTGGKQSNHCRQTLAYAKTLGMECRLVLEGQDDEPHQGNLLVFDIFGARLYFEPDEDRCRERCDSLALELQSRGKKPWVIRVGASTPLGCLGYIDCVEELALQAKEAGIKPGHIFLASGSAGTQAGVEVGTRLFLPDCKVHGVAVSRNQREQAEKVAALASDTAAFIGRDFSFTPGDIIIHDEYYGGTYGVPTAAGNEAIKTVGSSEAILLDPVYTGKAMSGLLDLLAKGRLDEGGDVVFIHTGGSPAVYNFAEYFTTFDSSPSCGGAYKERRSIL